MTSKQLERAWAKTIGIDRKQANAHLRELFTTIFERVRAGEEVRVGRFGKFVLETRKRQSNILNQVVPTKRVVFVPYVQGQLGAPVTNAIQEAIEFAEEQGKV